jgi:glutamyl-tRNA synthetase
MLLGEDVEKTIEKYALKNAYEYGKAEVGAVIGKVISEMPDVKKTMAAFIAKVKETIEKVNKMSREEIESAMQKYQYEERKKEARYLHVPGVPEDMPLTTRFAPEPGGYIHIGNAKAVVLAHELARQSGGKFHLRFDDTNPEKAKQEFVDAIKRDLNWLKIGWDFESFTSDSIELLYEYCSEMIRKGAAYVCECTQEAVKLGRRERRGCACREKAVVQNLKDFERMQKGEFKEGEAIVRFKGNMRSLNSVMRDPTLFRICETPHFRHGDKYLLWPSYDFACPILDSINGITHALRSKEYELRDELYAAILDSLELRKPSIITISRLQVRNNTTAKRILREIISKGYVKTWDDPRLLTISGLRRRGIDPEAIRKFVISFGIGKQENIADLEQLLVENRKILDPIAKRFHFVRNPITMKITNIEEMEIKLRLHPTNDLGERILKIRDGVVYIDTNDRPRVGEVIRLKDFCSVKILETKDREVIAERIETEEIPEKKIQWVGDNRIWANVLKPSDLLIDDKFNEHSLIVEEGICENECEQLNDGETIQFVRYGFVRKDGTVDGKLRFIFSC